MPPERLKEISREIRKLQLEREKILIAEVAANATMWFAVFRAKDGKPHGAKVLVPLSKNPWRWRGIVVSSQARRTGWVWRMDGSHEDWRIVHPGNGVIFGKYVFFVFESKEEAERFHPE